MLRDRQARQEQSGRLFDAALREDAEPSRLLRADAFILLCRHDVVAVYHTFSTTATYAII